MNRQFANFQQHFILNSDAYLNKRSKLDKCSNLGYTGRNIEPAKNYDVVSFARAMNPDFGSRVQKLFEVEKEAAIQALNSGEENSNLVEKNLELFTDETGELNI